mgnify:CR=1 FL=1|tara:strand:+ start:8122 stop:8460 length:339 start_codon:yes stop_codon:yes gene_type:complete
MSNENNKETINIYYLDNINGQQEEKSKLVVVDITKVFINYGDKMDEIVLNPGDEIRWEDNVIIYSGKLNHYKSNVTGEKLVVISENKTLKREQYIPPQNVKIAIGSGWETRD